MGRPVGEVAAAANRRSSDQGFSAIVSRTHVTCTAFSKALDTIPSILVHGACMYAHFSCFLVVRHVSSDITLADPCHPGSSQTSQDLIYTAEYPHSLLFYRRTTLSAARRHRSSGRIWTSCTTKDTQHPSGVCTPPGENSTRSFI